MQQFMVICVDGICDNLKKNTRGNCRTIVNSVCFYDDRTNMEEKLRVLRIENLIKNCVHNVISQIMYEFGSRKKH